MLIGELVERTGLTKDTIRFYEKKGLIVLDKIDRRENNYKEYSEQVLEKLSLIKSLRIWVSRYKRLIPLLISGERKMLLV